MSRGSFDTYLLEDTLFPESAEQLSKHWLASQPGMITYEFRVAERLETILLDAWPCFPKERRRRPGSYGIEPGTLISSFQDVAELFLVAFV